MVMPAVVVAAAVVGTAAVASSVVQSKAASKAASTQAAAVNQAAQTQADAAEKTQAMQIKYLEETRADIKKAVDLGLVDLDTGYNMAIAELSKYTQGTELQQYRGLLEDPSPIMTRPTTVSQMEAGSEALQAAFSRTSGGGLSGPAIQAATEFGQNLAAQSLDAELNRLLPLINLSASASSQIANLRSGLGTAKANIRTAAAANDAQLTQNTANSIQNSIQNAANAASGFQTQLGQINAAKAVNQANAATGLLSNLSNIGSQYINYAAVNPNTNLFSSFNAPTYIH
jgi:hypothetical protein